VRDAHGQPVALVGISRDVTELKRAYAARERQTLVVGGIATILEAALTASSEGRLGEICLQVAEFLTDSESGFIAEVGADGALRDLAVSDPGWRACATEDQSGHRRLPVDLAPHGLFGQVVLSGEPLVTNDPASHAESIGSPDGHPPLASFLGVPLKRGKRVTGLIAVANRAGGYEQEQVQNLEAVAPVIGEAIDRRRTEEALRQNELLTAAQLERNRLARDLHDSVTQALFAATIKAEALTLDQHAAPGVTAAAEDVRRLTRGALAQMRTLLLELRAEPVHEVPLQQLLRHLVEATESRASTSCRLTVRGGEAVPPLVHETLYRVAQEALNNVARHAHAVNAWVVLELEPGSARLVVGDDGAGFDFDASEVPAGHLGLISMRERATEAGATLSVTSVAGEGTQVVLEWSDAPEDGGAAGAAPKAGADA
jgi:signal transduction histidine kinase